MVQFLANRLKSLVIFDPLGWLIVYTFLCLDGHHYKVGPYQGYNSMYRGYNPSCSWIRPFIGVKTPFITGRGPPCSGRDITLFPCDGQTDRFINMMIRDISPILNGRQSQYYKARPVGPFSPNQKGCFVEVRFVGQLVRWKLYAGATCFGETGTYFATTIRKLGFTPFGGLISLGYVFQVIL